MLLTGVAHAAVPVSDVPRLGAETTTRSATTDTLSTGRQTNTSRHAISCSMHRSGKGPQGAAANNPEISLGHPPIAREEGVNENLALAVAYQESRFNPSRPLPCRGERDLSADARHGARPRGQLA